MSHKLLKQAEKDLETVVKHADAISTAGGSIVKSLLKNMGLAAAFGAVPAAAAYYFTKKDREQHHKDLLTSKMLVFGKNPKFEKSPDKFSERFSELSLISPVIAKNPNLAEKLVSKKFDSGFSLDDIHKLTAINAGTTKSDIPGAAARSAAGAGLNTFIRTFGPQVFTELGEQRAQLSDALADNEAAFKEQMNKNREEHTAKYRPMAENFASGLAEKMKKNKKDDEMNKKSSANIVSDECLGRMLADRHLMFKTAGVMDALKAGFKPGAEHLGKTLLFMAPALALGGGVELMRHVLDSRRNKALEESANHVFDALKKDSDKVKGNKALAQEAFDTLKAFAPTLASRPQVVKTFVEQVVDAERMPYQQVAEIADAENRVRGIKGESMLSGIKSTYGALGVSGPPKPGKKSPTLDQMYGGEWWKKDPNGQI